LGLRAAAKTRAARLVGSFPFVQTAHHVVIFMPNTEEVVIREIVLPQSSSQRRAQSRIKKEDVIVLAFGRWSEPSLSILASTLWMSKSEMLRCWQLHRISPGLTLQQENS